MELYCLVTCVHLGQKHVKSMTMELLNYTLDALSWLLKLV